MLVLVCWCCGVLVRCVGVGVVRWYGVLVVLVLVWQVGVDVLVFWRVGAVCWSGVLVLWYVGMVCQCLCLCVGVVVCWCGGVLVRCVGVVCW